MPGNRPTHIIVHCSDSTWGDARVIDGWHRERGWSGIGYHYVVLNGCRTYRQVKEGEPNPAEEGLIESGRPEEAEGSHCLGFNDHSIGICLIGVAAFTTKQLAAACDLVDRLRRRHGIPVERVLGHYETEHARGKTCPNLDMRGFRASLSDQRTSPRTPAAGVL